MLNAKSTASAEGKSIAQNATKEKIISELNMQQNKWRKENNDKMSSMSITKKLVR